MRLEAGQLEPAIAVDADLEREFETRLVESSASRFASLSPCCAIGRTRKMWRRRRSLGRTVSSIASVIAADLTWLVRISWRLALDRQRSERRRTAREQSESASPPAASNEQDAVVERDRAARLWRAIDTLPEKLRLVVVLVNIEGHDVAAAAELLRLPEGTVKSRLFLARQKLKELLSCATR